MAAILTDGGHLHSIQILKNTTYVYMKTEKTVCAMLSFPL